MRIISWNCNMAFRNKYEAIFDLKPDLLVLQECENVEKLSEKIDPNLFKDIFWYGDNPHKGVAIINFTDIPLLYNHAHNKNFKYILPFSIQNINIYTVWAMPHKVKSKSYVGQVWNAINYYPLNEDEHHIIIGDFNSHTQWNKERKIGNHSAVVSYLKKKSIVSLYHHLNQLAHGEEKLPTQYMYRHQDKPYHLDYCFASKRLIHSKSSIKIGDFDKWRQWSDHMPLIIDDIGTEIFRNGQV